mgnify:FL=1
MLLCRSFQKKEGMMNVKKLFKKLANRVRRFFCPTINEALWQYGIGEPVIRSKEELEELKKLIDELEEEAASK